MAKKYWLMKSEPDVFGIEALQNVGVEPWTGVRNYQARNFMRDDMSPGDMILFYHSNAKPSGVAGLARVKQTGLADPTAVDPDSEYFDPKSSPDAPRWIMVSVEFVERFDAVLSLDVLKATPDLHDMTVTQRGSRLSVQPVDKKHYDTVVKMARAISKRQPTAKAK